MELLGRYSNWTYWVDRTSWMWHHATNRPRGPAVLRATVRKLSSEEVDVLVERYRSGATMAELGELFKIHRTTVSAHLRRATSGSPEASCRVKSKS